MRRACRGARRGRRRPRARARAHRVRHRASLRLGIFDDGVVLYGEPDIVFRQLAKTGTQLVRVNLWWAGPGHPRRHAASRGDPADPTDPAYNWDTYDRTVRFSIVNGIEPVFSIIGTPPWANAAKGWNVAPTNARDLRLFAAAAQKRYSGTFVNADGVTLPRVSLWMAWNEPNNPVFLKPQYRRTGSELGDPVGPRLREDLQRDRPGSQVRPAYVQGRVRRDRRRAATTTRTRAARRSPRCRSFAR